MTSLGCHRLCSPNDVGSDVGPLRALLGLVLLLLAGLAAATGLTAEYFQGADLTDHRSTRTDAKLDGAERPPASIDVTKGFSVRWSGRYDTGWTIGRRTGLGAAAAAGDDVRVWVYVAGSLVEYYDSSDPSTFPGGRTFLYDPGGDDVEIDAEYDAYDGSGLVALTDPSGAVPSSELTPAVVTQAPTLSLAPGAGSVTLSWPAVSGAYGYNVYRATSHGAEDYKTPLNSSPVTGSGTVTYSDTTATAGTTYYYTVKAVYANSVTSADTFSDPSNEPGGASPGAVNDPIQIPPNPLLGIARYPFTLPGWQEGTVPSAQADAPGGGPSSSLGVSLPHGVVDVDSGPDLVVDNPTGESVVFERRYRTALAAANLSSPGLPAGWTHNWDYRIVPLQSGAWGPLKLVYPNGASETLVPTLTAGGSPTGSFATPSGAPYVATGLPGANFAWSSITLSENGLANQRFTAPAGDGVYRMTGETFENGQGLNLSYSIGRLTGIDNGGHGLSLTLSYGGTGGMLSLATDDATGNYRTYQYGAGGLTHVLQINCNSDEWAYGYTTIGGAPYLSTVTTTDPQGASQTATVAYAAGTGRASSVTDAKGDAQSFTYTSSSAKVSTTGAVGASDASTSTWDASMRTSSVANAAGDVTSFQYDATDPSQVVQIVRPLGGATQVVTDAHGNPTKVTYPYGNYTVYNWEYPGEAPLGRVHYVAEYGSDGTSNGETIYAYYSAGDPNGLSNLLQSVTRPNGGVTTYTYTSLGSVASVSGDTNATFTYTQGNATERYGKPYAVKDGVGKTTQLQYDAAGRVSGVQDPLGNVTTPSYNQYDQLTGVQMPLQSSLQIGYGSAGKAPTSSTITMGGVSRLLGQAQYDKESGLSAVTDANSLTNSATLDGHFDLSAVKNGATQTMHQFLPDPVNRKGQTIFGTGTKALTLNAVYDANGGVQSVAGSDNITLTVSRNNADPDLISGLYWSYPVQIGYGYDAFGRLNYASGDFYYDYTYQGYLPSYRHQYTYDAEDHVLTVDSGKARPDITYAYNPDGTRKSMLVFVAKPYSSSASYVYYGYGYDADKRVTSVTAAYADASKNITGTVASASYTYDADGRVAAVRTNKSVTLYAYDALGRLTGMQNLTPDGAPDPNAPPAYQVTDPYNGGTHTILSAFTNLTYDILGNRTGMASYGTGAPTFVSGNAGWGYDAAGRLTSEAWSGAATFSSNYGYDAGGNLTSLRGVNLAADSATDQLTGYFYDNSGNLGSSYDLAGRFVSNGGTSPYTGGSAGNERYTYAMAYDEAGRRRSLAIDTYQSGTGLHSSWTHAFTYDGDALVYRVLASASISTNNASDLSNTDANVFYLWGPTGVAMEFDARGHSKALAYDPQGNCVATSDGRTANPQFFDAYGRALITYAGDDRVRQQPLQYKGQYGYFRDAYDGLDYCLHRYYNPGLGRWTQRDPIGLEGGVNVYAYCGGNPIMCADPSGLLTIFGFEFTSQTVGNGLGTGLAATGEALSFGHYRNAYYAGQPGYGVSLGLAVVGREAAIQAATLGAGNAINAARAARAARVLGAGGSRALGATSAVAKSAAAVQLAANYQAGTAFERGVIAALGYAKNTASIAGRIPDIALQAANIEVKSGEYVSRSAQLRTFLASGKPLYLIVNTTTKVSRPLLRDILNAGGNVLRYDAVRGIFLPYP